ncbi:MAG: hypothetical protein ACHREM_01745 [Polyangiales bacterium]
MDSLKQGAWVLGLMFGYLVANLAVALMWSMIFSKIPFGWLASLILAPAPAAAASLRFHETPYWVVVYGVWAFALGAVTFTVEPEHATKSGGFDRRYKHNPDVSGITIAQRVVTVTGCLSVIVVMVIAWVQSWPGTTIK